MESVLLFGLKRGKETVIPPLTVGQPHRQAAAAGHQAGSMARALMELVLLPDLKRGGEAVILPLTVGQPHRQTVAAGHQAGSIARVFLG